METFLKRCWATINLNDLERNVNIIKSYINKDTKIMAAVKANAYGHGDKVIAKKLEELGISWFAVSNIEEAVALREQGIRSPILILGITPHHYAKTLNEYKITQAVFSLDYAKRLSAAAKNDGVIVDAHIKIDTGMGRIGFSCHADDFQKSVLEISDIYEDKNINCTGIFTHFSCSSDKDIDSKNYTLHQFDLFNKMCSSLELLGFDIGIKHCSNSAAIVNYPQMQLDMVRPGIIIYGLSASGDLEENIGLKPLMQVYSKIALIKTIHKGESVGYGKKFTATKDTKIATVTCGYADGYSRMFKDKAFMIINGHKAPIVGNICMDQTMIDVTDVPNVSIDDEITLIGSNGNESIGFDFLANEVGTIGYELVCNIGRRVPRVYIDKHNIVEVSDYLINII